MENNEAYNHKPSISVQIDTHEIKIGALQKKYFTDLFVSMIEKYDFASLNREMNDRATSSENKRWNNDGCEGYYNSKVVPFPVVDNFRINIVLEPDFIDIGKYLIDTHDWTHQPREKFSQFILRSLIEFERDLKKEFGIRICDIHDIYLSFSNYVSYATWTIGCFTSFTELFRDKGVEYYKIPRSVIKNEIHCNH